MEREAVHVPVMLEEVMAYLDPQPGQIFVEGTLGLGGHAKAFCDRIAPGGTLYGFDWDAKLFAIASQRLSSVKGVTLRLINQDFRVAAQVLADDKAQANGVLLDLGLNREHLEDHERGMSFLHEAPADMRMDQRVGEPVSAWLNRATLEEIDNVLRNYGDERWSRAIARSVLARRKEQPIRTTTDIVECVLAAIPVGARDKRLHPATRTFQALRIFINGELDGLDEAIHDLAQRLSPKGRIAVLSYHSGEDRIVKNAFRALAQAGFSDILRKPLQPTEAEIARNSPSRSAKMRVLERGEGGEPVTGSRQRGLQG